MICISIAQESRRLALVDMFNASKQCDLIELRLDRFSKAADISELLAHKPKPVIMSCRRPRDGGNWAGSEEERLTLLRQCIISKADYVEIELDVADQIRPFPPSKRVISYVDLEGTTESLDDVYAEACRHQPDVIKLVTLARTPEEAWPLVKIVARATVPTVAVGIGKPGIMLTILGKKVGSPWTYAALERGMETYPAQPTVRDLEEIYAYRSIDKGTRLIGVIGFTPRETATVAALNTALAHLGLSARCLPLAIGDLGVFKKVIDATRLASVVVDPPHRGDIVDIAAEREPLVDQFRAADVVLRKQDRWNAYNTFGRAALAALEETLRSRSPSDKPLQGRMVMIVGTNADGRMLAYGVKRRGGVPIIAGRDRQAAMAIAQEIECRQIPYEALYSTTHDVLIVASDESHHPSGRGPATPIHFGYLKPNITVMDTTAMPEKSELVREAEARSCLVVPPLRIFLDQLRLQLKLIAGQEVPQEVLKQGIGLAIEELD